MRRSAEVSAGLLAFRQRDALEVLLAHPGGPFWAKKDDGAWTIPKGLAEPGAGGDLLVTAKREFAEETNLPAAGHFIALDAGAAEERDAGARLGTVLRAGLDLASFASNTCSRWSGRRDRDGAKYFPEIDRIGAYARCRSP